MKKTTAHGRKLARGTGWQKGDALSIGVYRACKIAPEDREMVVKPARLALDAMRQGRATENDWLMLASVVRVAQAIEKQAIVSGLQAHIDSARQALQAIYDRAMRAEGWVPGALYAPELHAITEMVRLHKFQIDQLGRGELITALDATRADL